MNSYKPTIGIEVHAELKTKTKMFCSSKNDPHHSNPNTHVCPVCMAHPGTLPVINKEAVKHVIAVGLALGSEIATYTEFDRKNYFYPDIPKGYQISQYEYPIVKGGELNGVAITRVHLEEDTARSLHDQGDGSIIDYNRAGVPLMELVTEPVIHDAETAGAFARELQLLLKTLEVSDANMEMGEMRVEANISVSKTDTFGTKVEVKNLNSFKSVEGAIKFEINRQIELLEKGGSVVQETRGWDENKSKTFSQRKKESADDYRYFPDPDLPKLDLSLDGSFSLSRIEESLPELPKIRRSRYVTYGLSSDQIEVLVADKILASYFDEVIECIGESSTLPKLAANYITSDLVSLINSKTDSKLGGPLMFTELVTLVEENKLTSRVAKDLLGDVVFRGVSPLEVATEKGLLQDNSEESILPIVEQIIRDNPAVVAEFKGGKEASLQFLIGQGMKLTQGSTNPTILKELLQKNILK